MSDSCFLRDPVETRVAALDGDIFHFCDVILVEGVAFYRDIADDGHRGGAIGLPCHILRRWTIFRTPPPSLTDHGDPTEARVTILDRNVLHLCDVTLVEGVTFCCNVSENEHCSGAILDCRATYFGVDQSSGSA